MTIYFVHLAGDKSRVKIGHTAGLVKNRIRALQTGQPHKLVLLGTSPGDVKDEKSLHAEFRSIRINGEWFKFTKELECAINFLIDGQHPWYKCRQPPILYRKMETEWRTAFSGLSDKSAYADCAYSIMKFNNSGFASFTPKDWIRVRRFQAKNNGEMPPWCRGLSKSKGRVYKHESALCSYVKAWEEQGSVAQVES